MDKKLGLVLLAVFILAGCSLHSGSAYERGEMGQPQHFSKGVILSVRDVTVKGTESGVGTVSGAVAGGLAGSTIGGDPTTSAIGAIAGAVVGGLVGTKAEEVVMTGSATEFIIQPEVGEPFAVIQTNEQELKAGERVLIMDSDKIRVVRDQTSGQQTGPAK